MFRVGEIDVKGMARFENMLGALGADAPKAVNRALNRTGDMARTQVVRTLAKQTGLSLAVIRKAVKVKRSSWESLNYTMSAAGGDVSLKYFKPRETHKGVKAFVRGQGQVFEHTFLKGGSFARGRVRLNMGGHVFLRVGGRTDLEKQTSGVYIPAEMVDGATAVAFERAVDQNLQRRLDHEISRLLV